MWVADLHCDLLAYLTFKKGRKATDPGSRVSISQLQKGKVSFQVLAIYSHTFEKSVQMAASQFELFAQLPKLHPKNFVRAEELALSTSEGKTTIIAAIENAAGICTEKEDLDHAFLRLHQYQTQAGPLLYISLTWNGANRFGGGNFSKKGLTRDGELLLEYLSGKKIAVDLSHASDALAEGIFNHIDKKGLDLVPIASHSNFREVCDQKRNLPDPFVKEIVKRGGVIGLNFVKRFTGSDPFFFRMHVEHAKKLGVFDRLCFGADFFCDADFPLGLSTVVPFFFDDFSNASCYPKMIEHLQDLLSEEEMQGLCRDHLAQFFEERAHDDRSRRRGDQVQSRSV